MEARVKIYLDNVIVCGQICGDIKTRGDIDGREVEAMNRIYSAGGCGDVEIVTSRESHREQERTRDPVRRSLFDRRRNDTPTLSDDHLVFGFQHSQDHYGGFVASPIVSDVVDLALLNDFRDIGLKEGDARHLMYAVHNRCDWFVTTDPDFIERRTRLEIRSRGLRIAKPSEILDHIFCSDRISNE
jgi:hypothetical protein